MIIITTDDVAVPMTMKSPPLKVVGEGHKCNWFNLFYDCSVNFYNYPRHIRGPYQVLKSTWTTVEVNPWHVMKVLKITFPTN